MLSKLSTVTLFNLPLVVSSVAKFSNELVRRLGAVKGTRFKGIGPKPLAVMVVSMQDIMARRFQPAIQAAFRSFDYFTMDGMPLVWLARWLGYPAERIYGPDLFEAMLTKTHDRPIKHYFYGATPEALRALQTNLQARWPQLKIAGSYAPPFRALNSSELKTVIDQINRTKPDIIWVGLGSWKQLDWVHQAKPQLKTQLIIPVGMTFDLWAGVQRQAPRWVQRAGLEWLFRLAHQPARLWRRYVLQVPVFGLWWLGELIQQTWRHFWQRGRAGEGTHQ